MATLTDLRTVLQDWTGAGSTVLSTTITDACINGAIAQMQQAHLWRSQEAVSSTLSFSANTASVALPTDFISEKAAYLYDSTQATPSSQYTYLEKVRRDEWFEKRTAADDNTDQQFPQTQTPGSTDDTTLRYAIWDEKLWLYPTPQTAVVVVCDYWAVLTDLSSGSDSNLFTTRYPQVVRAGALAEAYAFLHEDERAALWTARFEGLLAKAILDDKTIAMSGGSYQRGV